MEFSESLKKNKDFQNVYQNGRGTADKLLVLYCRANGTAKNRLGISVSKKVGNSVVRHRVKRLVKESYRLNEERYKKGVDLVVVARKPAAGVTQKEVAASLFRLAKRQGVMVR